jgi:uncharacterized membrane protein YfhO
MTRVSYSRPDDVVSSGERAIVSFSSVVNNNLNSSTQDKRLPTETGRDWNYLIKSGCTKAEVNLYKGENAKDCYKESTAYHFLNEYQNQPSDISDNCVTTEPKTCLLSKQNNVDQQTAQQGHSLQSRQFSQHRALLKGLCTLGWIFCCPCWTIGLCMREQPNDADDELDDPCLICSYDVYKTGDN